MDKSLGFIPDEHGKRRLTRDCTGCMPHPMRGEVDEDIPRARGGSPYERSNCHLMHRKCNEFKGKMTLAESRAKLHGRPSSTSPSQPHTATQAVIDRTVIPSPIW